MAPKIWQVQSRGSAEQVAFLRRIEAAGCPLEVDEAIEADPGGLTICQTGPMAFSSVFDLDPLGTGFMVHVAITCKAAEFCIDGYELLLPWKDPQFRWLEAIDGVPKWQAYSFPGKHAGPFHFDEVINHCKSRLRRGREIEGWLLGWGPVSIPDLYQRGGINAKLSVLDHLGTRCSETLLLCVDRSSRPTRPVLEKPSGKTLWTAPDGVRKRGRPTSVSPGVI